MKKFYLVLAALILQGTVNATSWRVCSKTEAGANFTSVADAVASNLVFAGDTLYVEPGHVELQAVNISKRLHLIGPGYRFVENGVNAMDLNEAVFTQNVNVQEAGCSISGCVFLGGLRLCSSMTCTNNCFLLNGIVIGQISDVVFRNNFVFIGLSKDAFVSTYLNSMTSCIFDNNIFYGKLSNEIYSCSFLNNTIVAESYMTTPILNGLHASTVHNNIIINTNQGFSTTQNSNQTYDTTWYGDYVLNAPVSEGNSVSNNVFSCPPNAEFLNSVFNVNLEDVLIWNDANTAEEMFKHKANGPAVGAGINGTTCGAYGHVNGGRAYQPVGIPQYRPYIFDANIDDTPNANNSINASFKIKVQQ